jgi:UPF0755 protein
MLHRFVGILFLLASFAGAWAWMAYQRFVETPLSLPSEGAAFLVPSGATVAAVAGDLSAAGFIDDPIYLVWYARWKKLAHRIRAGEFRLEPGMTAPEFLDLLVSGKTISHSLTLIEGWTFKQVRAAVAGHAVILSTLGELSDAEIMRQLGLPDEHPEGRFFPDTYLFPKGTTDLAFLKRTYRRMQDELAKLWPERAAELPLKTPYQALILASIVEKETGLAEERPHIAGVFVNRLRRGMRLQTDPTVIYGLGERFDGNLRRVHLQENTPYNTYVHAGLPPTPICMPGRAALAAVLNPLSTEDLYFVARGDGSHEFSETLRAHNNAVRKYQLTSGT